MKYLSIVLLLSFSLNKCMEEKIIDAYNAQLKCFTAGITKAYRNNETNSRIYEKDNLKERYRLIKEERGLNKSQLEAFIDEDIALGMKQWSKVFTEDSDRGCAGTIMKEAKAELLSEYPRRRANIGGLASIARQSVIISNRSSAVLVPCADVPVSEPDALRFIPYNTFLDYSFSSGSTSSSSSSEGEEDVHTGIIDHANIVMNGDLAPDGWAGYAKERHKLQFNKDCIAANTGLFGWNAANHVLELKKRMDDLSTGVAINVVITPEKNLKSTALVREGIQNAKEALDQHYQDTYNE